MNRLLGSICALALPLAACVSDGALMRTGELPRPVTLDAGDLDVQITYVKAGTKWTNVWIDARVHAKGSAEVTYEPSEFAIFAPSTGLTYKQSLRAIVVVPVQGVYGRPGAGPAGVRDGRGVSAFTPQTSIKPGETIPVTMMFEIPGDQVKQLDKFDLVYKVSRAHFESAPE
jgi:hypothetical protein